MKKLFLILIVSFSLSLVAKAQSPAEIANAASEVFQNPTGLNMNFGFINIDGEAHIGMRFQPELKIGKFGIGLNVPLMYNIAESAIRTEEYEDGIAYLRLIDYLSWGKKKKDPLYIKVGRLNGSYLGFGILLNNYSNSLSFEKRAIGAEFDFQIKKVVGLEGMYGNFDPSSLNLIAARPYVKPFGATKIPIIKTMEIGIGVVTDFDQMPSLVQNNVDTSNASLANGMTGISADLGFFILNTDILAITTYAQYGRLLKNDDAYNELNNLTTKELAVDSILASYGDGHGFSVGVATRISLLFGALQLNARLERLWYTNYFMPQFFDYNYVMNKSAKIEQLASSEAMQGIYGSLTFNMIDKVFVGGGLLLPDQVDGYHPASVYVNVDIPDLLPKFYLSGRYYRGGIDNLAEAFVLDEKAQCNAVVAYRILPFFLAGVDYKWTFVPTKSDGFSIDHQIMPYVGFNYPLNF